MKAFKKLSGETAIYGFPSILGRFINWVLNPYWTYVFINQADLGKVTNIYSYIAFLFVFLTFGMETGFFRFAAKEKNTKVFSTSFFSVLSSTAIFLIALITFKSDITAYFDLEGYSLIILIIGATLALDVVAAIPFAQLRMRHQPIRFSTIKFINIFVNVILNILFLTLIPYIVSKNPDGFIADIYVAEFGIGYVFLSNLVASFVTLILLIPGMNLKFTFDTALFKRMLHYSFPILIVGITGIINQNIDKILIPELLPESSEPFKQLGIYAASFKLGIVLNMFTQAFRFAFEPFFFSQKNDEKDKGMYVIIMKYFIIFGLIIFLALSTFIDLFKLINDVKYRDSIDVVPIVLMANLFMGIYFTLSLWYKVSDKTKYGAYMGIMGSVITVSINLLLIPVLGYYGSAIAYLSCFVVMVIVSYLLSKKHYPIPYNIKNFLFYLFVAIALFGIYWMVRSDTNSYFWLSVIVNIIFILIVWLKEGKELKRLIRS